MVMLPVGLVFWGGFGCWFQVFEVGKRRGLGDGFL